MRAGRRYSPDRGCYESWLWSSTADGQLGLPLSSGANCLELGQVCSWTQYRQATGELAQVCEDSAAQGSPCFCGRRQRIWLDFGPSAVGSMALVLCFASERQHRVVDRRENRLAENGRSRCASRTKYLVS